MPSPMHLRQNRPLTGQYGEEELDSDTASSTRYEVPRIARPAVTPPPPVEYNPNAPRAAFPSISTVEAASREHESRVERIAGDQQNQLSQQQRQLGLAGNRHVSFAGEVNPEPSSATAASDDPPMSEKARGKQPVKYSNNGAVRCSSGSELASHPSKPNNPPVRSFRPHRSSHAGPSGTQAGPSGRRTDTDPSNSLQWKAMWWSSDDQARFMKELETDDEGEDGPRSYLGNDEIMWDDLKANIRVEIVHNMHEEGHSNDKIVRLLGLTPRQRHVMADLAEMHNRTLKGEDEMIRDNIDRIQRKLNRMHSSGNKIPIDEELRKSTQALQNWIEDHLDLKPPMNGLSLQNVVPPSGFGAIVDRNLKQIWQTYCGAYCRTSKSDLKKARAWLRSKGLHPSLAGSWRNAEVFPNIVVQSTDGMEEQLTRAGRSKDILSPLLTQMASISQTDEELGNRSSTNVQAGPQQAGSQQTSIHQAGLQQVAGTTGYPRSSVGRDLLRMATAQRPTSVPTTHPTVLAQDAAYAPQVLSQESAALNMRSIRSAQIANTPYFQQYEERQRRNQNSSRIAELMASTGGAPSPVLQQMYFRAQQALPTAFGTPAPTAMMTPAPTAVMTPVVPSNASPLLAQQQFAQKSGNKRAASFADEFEDFSFSQAGASQPSNKRQRLAPSNFMDPSMTGLSSFADPASLVRTPSRASIAESVGSQGTTMRNSTARAMRSAHARSLPRRFSGPHSEIGTTGYSHIDVEAPPMQWARRSSGDRRSSGFAAFNDGNIGIDGSSYPDPEFLGNSLFDGFAAATQPDFMQSMMDQMNFTQADMASPNFMQPSMGQTTSHASFGIDSTYGTVPSSLSSSVTSGISQGSMPQIGVVKKRGRPRKDESAPKAAYFKRK